ncbi:MAG TPA: hypothetical protein VFG49_06690 [Dyella sp.]|nr:hypothetical protein [Dyella sp.]HET6553212.1 hypothetical protein [Dyella sp.]
MPLAARPAVVEATRQVPGPEGAESIEPAGKSQENASFTCYPAVTFEA